MQKNADTTYMIQYTGDFIGTPLSYLLSKKGDTITTYSYSDNRKIDKRLKSFPRVIKDSIFRKNAALIYFLPVGVNIFFNPIYLSPDSLQQMWRAMGKLNTWQLRDDKIDGEGCVVKQNKDGSYNQCR